MTCDFAVIERLDVHAVIDSYRRLYAHGRHGAPPDPVMYQWVLDRGPSWVRAVLPLDYLDFQTEDESSQERVRRAKQYAARGTPFPPGTASYGGRSRRRRSGKAYVQDGNHRVLAAHFRGDCAIEMFMPEDEFFAVVEDARWREGGMGEMREAPKSFTRAWIMYPEAGAVVAEPVDVRAGGATLEMREDSLDSLIESTDARYPRAGEYVDGRLVREHVPNLDSIDGYMAESETISGIRVVPMSDFGNPRSVFYAAGDFERSERLAELIGRSGEINPLIVGVDEKGPFIIEGAHRFVALWYLKAHEFPAVVVVGRD